MRHSKQENLTLTEGVIWKQVLVYLVPIVIGSFFQQLYNMADTIIVGHYVGTKALAAVGSTGPVTSLLVGFFVGVSAGATVVIAQYYGADFPQRVSDAVHTALALALISGLLVTGIGIAITYPLLRSMNMPADVLPDAALYMIVYFAGCVGNLLYNIGTGILRSVGDSRRPLYILIACCVLNILLDLLFVLAFRWGVFGVGFATILSQLISAILVLVCLMKTTDVYRVSLRKIRLHVQVLKEIIRIGLPSGFESVLYNVSNIIIQSYVNAFGTAQIAAWSTTGKLDAIIWLIMQAFGIACGTFVGQNFGAGKYDRMRKCIRTILVMDFGSIAVLSVIVYTFCPFLMRIFTEDAEVIANAAYMMRFFCPFYVMFVFINIFASSIRACGEAMTPMLITTIGICGLRFLWIFLILPLHHTIGMLSLSYGVSWTVTAAVFTFYYLRKGWLRRCMGRMQTAA